MTKQKRPSSKTGKSGKKQSKRTFSWWMIIVPLCVLALLVGGWLIRNRPGATATIGGLEVPTLAPAPQYLAASYCQSEPAFVREIGFEGTPIIGTSLADFVGFVVGEQMADGSLGRVYQHPTWENAGYLGAYTRDGVGNVYVAPAPFSSIELNPPEEQTIVHIIDTNSSIMEPFANVPAAQPPTEQNPFGVMGLFFDCDTNSLYAASIAGSTAQDEVGRIVQIDATTREIVDQLDGLDPLGVGIYNGVNGKRLYYGLGRNSAVLSIGLDEKGHFSGEPRQEFFLAGLPGGGNEKAQRITFNQAGQMIIKGVEFDYTLRASSDAVRALYMFNYVPEEDSWELDKVERTDAPMAP